jgi:hypothetical protein
LHRLEELRLARGRSPFIKTMNYHAEPSLVCVIKVVVQFSCGTEQLLESSIVSSLAKKGEGELKGREERKRGERFLKVEAQMYLIIR